MTYDAPTFTYDAAQSVHKFTGKERDSESGLDNFGARYMASTMGRFMTPDPLLNSGRPGSPQTWNRYAYALNNPLKIVDPTGLYNVDCGSDKTCNKAAKDLKNGLSDLQKRVDKMKDPGLSGFACGRSPDSRSATGFGGIIFGSHRNLYNRRAAAFPGALPHTSRPPLTPCAPAPLAS